MSNLKYKEGDRVLIKSIDWYNENKDENGDVLCFYGVHKFTKEMSKFCGKIVTISTNLIGDGEYLIKDDDETDWWTDDMIECKVEEENTDCENCGLTRNSIRCLFMDNCPHNKQKNIIEIPEGYVLKDENDNIINATKIVLEKKKKEYPKTYCECKDILGLWDIDDTERGYYKTDLIDKLQMLLICRDAYWKIAGEEMGLGKPWEPNWETLDTKYDIYNYRGVISHNNFTVVDRCVLVFPTEEMRDAFYENFKSEIESCKELL